MAVNTVCKMKAAGVAYETMVGFLSSCGADVGNIGHGRNQFPEIINTAYHYVIQQTQNFLKEPLTSTGLRPHVSVAVDKSTPQRDTNRTSLVLLPVNGKRVAMPLDAPLVYSVSAEGDIEGGSGQHLAEQVVDALRNKLKFNDTDMNYLFMLNGQYQANTFQDALYTKLGKNNRSADPFFLTTWDASHWMDLVMVEMQEENGSSAFLKRLIKRSNRLHTMFA
ncbi:Hypothetical predicted protein [Paramuricea clavata]|uniref:Uncharacterized protein n=1 Tax=Paramuricea clavata TaxID=317549 RepID=A0A6S7K6G3_PARCT|nr:Hypothetical predicted protein [Paramuricea clavata]